MPICGIHNTTQLKFSKERVICVHIRKGPRKPARPRVRINNGITAPKVRLIDAEGKNVGVVGIKEALLHAQRAGLDLIEVTAKADPPVVCIADQGKYQYEQNKKMKQWAQQDREKGKKNQEEVKHIQIKPGTSGDIITMRSKKIREWLDEGKKVNVTLFLFGRYKYMEEAFLKEKLNAFIQTIPGEVIIKEEAKKSGKGFSILLQ